MSRDLVQARRAVSELLRALGHDPENEPDLGQTPALVVEALERDWLCGYLVDIPNLFVDSPKNPAQNAPVVVVSRIALGSLCPHHLLPAEGTATVAYLPGQILLGLGTIARLVDAYARRLTLQERIGQNVVAALMQYAGANGAYCRVVLRHACLRLRGPRQANAIVSSVHTAGEFDTARGQQRLAQALRGEPSR